MATTGAKFPGVETSVAEDPWLDDAWVSPGNVAAADTVYATIVAPTYDAGDQSQKLRCTGFDFSAISNSATIDGVIVIVGGASYQAGTASIDLVQLVDNGTPIGDNKRATAVALTASDANYTQGSASDLWNATLTPAIVKSSTFGVDIGVIANSANTDVRIDYVTVEVYYTAPIASDITAATGTSTASTLTGGADFAAVITSAVGASTAATLTGSSTGGSAFVRVSWFEVEVSGFASASITAAAGVSTTSALTASSSAAATITAATGLAAGQSLAGSASASSAITAAAGTTSAGTLAGVAGSADSSIISAAAGVSTAGTLAGKSAAAATITAAAGATAAQTLAGGATFRSAITAAAGVAAAQTLTGSSTIAGSVITAAAGSSLASVLAGSSIFVGSLTPAAGTSTAAVLYSEPTIVRAPGIARSRTTNYATTGRSSGYVAGTRSNTA